MLGISSRQRTQENRRKKVEETNDNSRTRELVTSPGNLSSSQSQCSWSFYYLSHALIGICDAIKQIGSDIEYVTFFVFNWSAIC